MSLIPTLGFEGDRLKMLVTGKSDPPRPEAQVKFLMNLQRLLNEGQFVATYKFALLLALADICVEAGDDSGEPLKIETRSIADRFIRY